MNDLFLSISAGTVDWSRAQFALTAIYHWLFVPLTLGLALIMGIMETCYYLSVRKAKRDGLSANSVPSARFWKDASRFWQKLFGINFAMGVATGIILEFEFGTNWSNYSWLVGDIFGAPLALKRRLSVLCFSVGTKCPMASILLPHGLPVLAQQFQPGGFLLPMRGCSILSDRHSIRIRCVTR